MDRKIELDQLSEEIFQDLMTTVSSDIILIAKEAQSKINDLLRRFNIRCDLTLNYGIITTEPTSTLVENLPSDPAASQSEPPIKKKRSRKKKTN